MSRWIAELKKRACPEREHRQNRQNSVKPDFVDFGSSPSGQISEFFAPDANDIWVQYEERAAILEYDGGHSRADAERLARGEVFGSDRLSNDEIDALIEIQQQNTRSLAGAVVGSGLQHSKINSSRKA